MKYFIDTEVKEKPHTIDLISIGIVCEDGREYYAISNNFNLKEVWKDEWLRENVLKTLYSDLYKMVSTYDKTYHWRLFEPFTRKSIRNLIRWYGKTNVQIAKETLYFCSNGYFDQTGFNLDEAKKYELYDQFKPEFYAYYADYDWVVFWWLFGRMMDLPKGFPMYCKDLKQMMDEKGLDKDWKRENCPDPEGEHNALVDARWNLRLYNALTV